MFLFSDVNSKTVLGYDAFKIHFAHALKQRHAMSFNVVRVEHSGCGSFRQQSPQFVLAICQLLRSQVFPITHQQVEREKARLTPMKEQVTKLRSSTLIKADDFTIENGFSSKRQCHSLAKI